MLEDEFVYLFLTISVVLAIVMGLVQCLAEDFQRTWRYVLAFPGGWPRIVKLKLACGAAVWLAWSVGSIVICLIVIAFDHGPPGETYGRMFDPMLRILFSVPIVYLGAFLTALRPAHWIFSRLMPLGGVLLCWFLLLYLPSWWVLAPMVTVSFSAVLEGIMFHVAASRDFA